MNDALRKGDHGPPVRQLQQRLAQRGYAVADSGSFDAATWRAVRAFQAQNLDQHGQPPSAVDYTAMPADGGSARGRAALAAAIGELKSGACESGGNNCGAFIRKYLAPAGVAEGNSWCASFVSWCFLQAAGGDTAAMPFAYVPGARAMLAEFKAQDWARAPGSGYPPQSGDIVVWWRVNLRGWLGHVGLVHSVRDGMLYTIEGNRSPRVQGFSYVLSRMDRLLGFGHVP